MGCLTQTCSVLILGGLESFLPAAMAHDCCVSVCHPLVCLVLMKPRLCLLLTPLSLPISTANAPLHSLLVLRLSCEDLKNSPPLL